MDGMYHFPNNAAKYSFLQTKWPLHKHRILAYMTFKRIKSKLIQEENTISREIADLLDIKIQGASRDLKQLEDRGFMNSEKVGNTKIYRLTERGKEYGENIWIKWDHYKLDLFKYIFELDDVFSFDHPYADIIDEPRKEKIYQRYTKLIEAKNAFMEGKRIHNYRQQTSNEVTESSPVFLVDRFIEEAMILKHRYNWSDQEFYRYLVWGRISYDGDIHLIMR